MKPSDIQKKIKKVQQKAEDVWWLCDELEDAYNDLLADQVEAGIMKKTTQRSPEWFGGANC